MQTLERNETFEMALKFVTETNENIFLTGKAGTGKTTFLKTLVNNINKNVVVAAPTGVAAINAGGVTLHSLFQLPFHAYLPNSANRTELLRNTKFSKQRIALLNKIDVLIIDEISMVRCDTLDAIDAILRSVRRNHSIPFGGVQLLLIGDLFQLAPVAQTHEWVMLQQYYESPYFYESVAIKEQQPLLIELNKVYRQQDDEFIQLLNNVRNNRMQQHDYDLLNQRYIHGSDASVHENYITLTTHNNQAQQINNNKLQAIGSPAFTFKADINGDFNEKNYPVEENLVLKVGAQVMFLKNDSINKKYFNGKIGVVYSIEGDNIVVKCDEELLTVCKDIWENIRYKLDVADGKLQQEILGSFVQYPLRLAWAITIHKSQGLTFNKIKIDAAAAFSSGQVYVALSRCTTLHGIVLLSKIPQSAIQENANVANAQKKMEHKGDLTDRFTHARKLFTELLLHDVFSFNKLAMAATQLVFKANQFKDKFSGTAFEWLQNIEQKILDIKKVGEKFIPHINKALKEEPIIENNTALLERLRKAAQHFLPLLNENYDSLQSHKLNTEFKDAVAEVNEKLNLLALQLHTHYYNLKFFNSNINLNGFLDHKLNYVPIKPNLTCYAIKQSYTNNSQVQNLELYEILLRWRNDTCEKNDIAPYMVCNAKSIEAIATFLPLTNSALLRISGFGNAKVKKYGDEILETTLSYCERYSLKTQMDLYKPKASKRNAKPTKEN
jgi:hypothetical protein